MSPKVVVNSSGERLEFTGAEHLRAAVAFLGYCREGFLDNFSAPQLLRLWEACVRCEFDVFPDQFTRTEVRHALRGDVAALNKSLQRRFDRGELS